MLKQWLVLKILFYLSAPPDIPQKIFSFSTGITWEQTLSFTGGDNSNKRCFGAKPKLFRESGNFSRNRDTWNFFRETRDNSGTLQRESGHRRKFYFMYPKNSGGWSKFPGRLKLRPSIAQTAFVRVVIPRFFLMTICIFMPLGNLFTG